MSCRATARGRVAAAAKHPQPPPPPPGNSTNGLRTVLINTNLGAARAAHRSGRHSIIRAIKSFFSSTTRYYHCCRCRCTATVYRARRTVGVVIIWGMIRRSDVFRIVVVVVAAAYLYPRDRRLAGKWS